MKFVEVLPKEAEKIRKLLSELKLIDLEYKITNLDGKILIPLKRLSSKIKHLKIIEANIENLVKRQSEKINILKKCDDKIILPKSYDIVGNIAIVDIPAGSEGNEKKIAEYIMRRNKAIKVVTKKVGIHKGVFRTQDLKVIAGEKRKETTHKENNVLLKLNVETCYFSPRLSSERMRIARMVNDREDIMVMFSGVAPYPAVISKNANPRNVYGIELNPEAHLFASENVRINKTLNVHLIKGDVSHVCGNIYPYIIGLKSSRDPKELEKRLRCNPQIMELHLFEEDLYEKKELLERTIKNLQEKGIRVMLHMPFTCMGKPFSLATKNPKQPLAMLKVLGGICKKHRVCAVVHPVDFLGDDNKCANREKAEHLIKNLITLKDYYDFFYFENLTKNPYAKMDDILDINIKAGVKNVCIDLAHAYMVYKSNRMVINHIKNMQARFNTYFHVNDCDGITHSTEIGNGKIDFSRLLPYINFGVVEVISKDEFNPNEMIRSYDMLSRIKARPKTFDRIIMPLPKSAESYLENAKQISKKGTTIHFYDFVHESEMPDKSIMKIKKHFPEAMIKSWAKCGQYAPGKWRICIDFKV